MITEANSEWLFTSPRPASIRCAVDFYPIVTPIGARYSDMDFNGHLNNLALQALHEDARATLNARAYPGLYRSDSRSLRLVTSQNVVHFLAEAHWPATIQAGVGVARVGNTSFVASSALFVGPDCISVCDTVLVAVGEDARPVAIDQQARVVLQSLVVGDARSSK